MSPEETSDEELVRRFRAGDTDAFDALVCRFQDRVFRLASVWLHDRQQADDVTQEVFVRGFRGFRRFRFEAAPFTWLYRTTRNVCREYNRRRRAEPLPGETPDGGAGPEQSAVSADAALRVRRLVAVLPKRQREVVLLRIFEELSVRETATAMGCREGTVKALLHKAMANLRKQMTTEGLGDD